MSTIFGDVIDSSDVILINRLNRVVSTITESSFPTIDEYQAEITSLTNKAFNLRNKATPLQVVNKETPALTTAISSNITNLSNDCIDLANNLQQLENNTSNLYNLIQSQQTSLRQTIRESIYSNSSSFFQEQFINSNYTQSNTSYIDTSIGRLLLPIKSNKLIKPILVIGTGSIGSSNDELSNIVNNVSDTGTIPIKYTWNGSYIEIIMDFSAPQIINRLFLQLNDYEVASITQLYGTADGINYVNLLSDQQIIDLSANKFTGNITIDFDPVYVSKLKISLQDITNIGHISIRELATYSIQYENSGIYTSTKISIPGTVQLNTQDHSTNLISNIIYQISYDNITFTTVKVGLLNIIGDFWFRIILTKSSTNSNISPLATSGDPNSSSNYTLGTISTTNISNNLVERTINLTNVTGPIIFNDNIIASSLAVYNGPKLLNTSSYTYNINTKTLTLNSSYTTISIVYQTSIVNSINLSNYYTPFIDYYTLESI